MIRALFFIIKVGLLVAVAVWVANRPGLVAFDWMGYDVTADSGLVLLGLLVLVTLILLFYRMVWGLVTLPARWRRYTADRRKNAGFRALTVGLTAIAAGDARQAAHQASRARRFLPEDQGLTTLLEGQVARLQGDDRAARAAFQALLLNKDTAFLGLRGLLVLALETNDIDEAQRLTRHALGLHPRQPWLVRTAYELELRQGRWDTALTLLRRAEKISIIDAAQAQSDRAVLFLQQADEAREKGRLRDALKFWQAAHKANPALIPAAQRLAHYYLEHKGRKKAVAVLEATWRLQPHPDLVPLWREAAPVKTARDNALRMRWFEALVALKPDSAEGQMAAASEALEQGLYGLAAQYLDRADELEPSARLYRLRARLAQKQSRPEEASLMHRKAADAPRDKVWYCRHTGRVYDHWAPIAYPHAAFNSIEWGHPRVTSFDRALTDRSELLFAVPRSVLSVA